MNNRLSTVLLSLSIPLILSACTATLGGTTDSARNSVPVSCPTPPTFSPPVPGYSPPVGAAAPGIVTATSITPTDTSTSHVISPDPADQITCGKTAVRTISDVVFNTLTLPNGKKKELALDIQIPEGPGKKPLVIYVTGGGFVIAPKENGINLRTYVAESGFIVASIQYRVLSDGATYRDSLVDVKSAIRYLRAHADEYGINADKVAIWGESAGGYLVAMVGVTSGMTEFDVGQNLDQSSTVQAVVDKFGSSDMSRIAADFDNKTQSAYASPDNPIALYVNGAASGKGLLDDPTTRTTANPLTYINASDPPFLLFHGSRDTIISPSQTLILHNALAASGVQSTRYVLSGAGHGDIAFLGDPQAGLPWSTNQVMEVIVEFLRRTIN